MKEIIKSEINKCNQIAHLLKDLLYFKEGDVIDNCYTERDILKKYKLKYIEIDTHLSAINDLCKKLDRISNMLKHL